MPKVAIAENGDTATSEDEVGLSREVDAMCLVAETIPPNQLAKDDLGFRVGGPLSKDRLWFYAAYNPLVEKRDTEVVTLGIHTDKAITHRFAGKLT